MKRNLVSINFTSGNLMMIIGTAIAFTCIIYALCNFYKLDSIVKIWLPFMIAGVFCIYMGLLMSFKNQKRKRGHYHFNFLNSQRRNI